MKKILAFGASSSRNSINKKLATYAASQILDADVTLLDLNDFEMPIFSIDKEKENGVHELAQKFHNHIKAADGILISFAEHNGSYSTAFKNIMDWTSRLEGSLWQDKPLFLMATSPGGRGGKTVLEAAVDRAGRMGGNVIANFSLPSFKNNFSEESGITDTALNADFQKQLFLFASNI